MKDLLSILILTIFTCTVTFSQIQKPSQLKLDFSSKSEISTLHIAPPSVTLQDLNRSNKGRSPFGKVVSVDIDFVKNATWIATKNLTVGRLKIESKGASALSLYYDTFHLPEGSELIIYNEDKSEIIGAFTSENHKPLGNFATGILNGEACIIEYYSPQFVTKKPKINISGVGYAYKNMTNLEKDFGDADPCEVNVNCSEGAAWQEQKDAVARLLVLDNGSQYWCSGAMINNEREDCTPYFLTAEHCGLTSTPNDIAQWIFYFQYESPNCANPPSEGTLANKSLTGATLKAQSNDNGGDSGSDFMLLELSTTPPSDYNVFYAGWNRMNTPSPNGVSIHHPDGDIKKISTYINPLTTSSFGGITPNTHWAVLWSMTANGTGVTEVGSSGSPIFNPNGQIVGKLTGGISYCNDTTGSDEYGKLSYSWASNGSTANRQLKVWLDPDNTGITELDGVYAPCGTSTTAIHQGLNFEVFPNPSQDYFILKLDNVNSYKPMRVYIYNTLGQVVDSQTFKTTTTQRIGVNHLPSGTYIISVEHDNATASKKVAILK